MSNPTLKQLVQEATKNLTHDWFEFHVEYWIKEAVKATYESVKIDDTMPCKCKSYCHNSEQKFYTKRLAQQQTKQWKEFKDG